METTAEGVISYAGGAQAELRNHDKYCWYCHETCSKHHCSTCFRSFHDICLRSADKMHRNNSLNVLMCPVCLSLKKLEESIVDKQQVLNKLRLVKNEIKICTAFNQFNVLLALPDWTESETIVNPINLKDVFDQIDGDKYNSFEAFLADIECIFHNCKIHFGRRNEITKVAKNLTEFCKFEHQCISACVDCYDNYFIPSKTEWRTMACRVPHLILWAKLDPSIEFWPAKHGFTYWPAKLLAVNGGNALIIFFGDYKFDDVRAQDCYLYSSKPPSSATRSSGNSKGMKPALKEVELYIKNVEKKFGFSVNKSLENVLFNRRQIHVHMKAMFPDYNGQANANEKGGANKSMKNVENIENDSGEVPAKRSRFNDEDTVIQKNVNSSTDSDCSSESDGSSGRDTDDDISGNIVKLYGQYISKRNNLSNKKKQKINCLKGENDDLRKQLDDSILKQTELKNDHSKEVAAIKATLNKEIAEMKQIHEKNGEDFKALEKQLKITKKLLDKATRKIDDCKACAGCDKPLDGLCTECSNCASTFPDTENESSIETDDD